VPESGRGCTRLAFLNYRNSGDAAAKAPRGPWRLLAQAMRFQEREARDESGPGMAGAIAMVMTWSALQLGDRLATTAGAIAAPLKLTPG
jgi:hypothetical protein